MKKKKKQKAIHLEKCIEQLVKQYFHRSKEANHGGYLHAELIARVERELIQQVFQQTAQNQSQTAKVLGISRTTLRKKMDVLALATDNAETD